MGLFKDIATSIAGQAATIVAASKPASAGAPATKPVVPGSPSSASQTGSTASSAAGPSLQEVDVAAVLDSMAKKNPEKLDWKKSIVDLMKLVGMDSSLSARKQLAKELNYSGDTGDSAKMNVWLHKEVLRQLSANGGKVPASLLD